MNCAHFDTHPRGVVSLPASASPRQDDDGYEDTYARYDYEEELKLDVEQ